MDDYIFYQVNMFVLSLVPVSLWRRSRTCVGKSLWRAASGSPALAATKFLLAEIFYWPAWEKWKKPRVFTPKLEFQIVALLYLSDLSSISEQSVGRFEYFPPKYLLSILI